jgi:hypothetical protein
MYNYNPAWKGFQHWISAMKNARPLLQALGKGGRILSGTASSMDPAWDNLGLP